MSITHISIAKEVDPPKGADLRTRKGREAEVIQQIETFNGFSVFWATENQKRAWAITRLEEAGTIRSTKTGSYPWCGYEVV